MSRIRTIKPDLFKHEALFEAEQGCGLPLRLTFIALLTCCDREGRFRWQVRRLKLDLLPYDDIDLADILKALQGYGFIQQYSHQGKLYGCIPSWAKHQYCNQREPESDLPPLEGSTLISPQRYTKNPEKAPESSLDSEACTALCDVQDTARARTCGREGGREWRRGRGRERTLCRVSATEGVMHANIQSVFEHWQQTMQHPQAVLDPKRYVLIRKALSLGYSVEQLCQAITGCSLTPHNWGDNDRGTRYDGLHIILRDAEQIDRFMHNAQNPPRVLNTAERQSRNNADVFKRWSDSNVLQEGVYEAQ